MCNYSWSVLTKSFWTSWISSCSLARSTQWENLFFPHTLDRALDRASLWTREVAQSWPITARRRTSSRENGTTLDKLGIFILDQLVPASTGSTCACFDWINWCLLRLDQLVPASTGSTAHLVSIWITWSPGSFNFCLNHLIQMTCQISDLQHIQDLIHWISESLMYNRLTEFPTLLTDWLKDWLSKWFPSSSRPLSRWVSQVCSVLRRWNLCGSGIPLYSHY